MSNPFMLNGRTAPEYEQVTVFEGMTAGEWTVEAITDAGDVENQNFTGPNAEAQALEYARGHYRGHKVTVGRWIRGNPRFQETGSFTA
jgi:hypothetical protein